MPFSRKDVPLLLQYEDVWVVIVVEGVAEGVAEGGCVVFLIYFSYIIISAYH